MIHRHSLHHVHRHVLDNLNQPGSLASTYAPDATIVESATLVRRTSTGTSTCTGSSSCETSKSSNLTNVLPVVLGVVIPCVCAIVAIFVLHRRYVHRLRYEDAHDKHKSLDFGMEVVRANPEMGEKPHKRGGLSLDVGNSPYLLPPGLHDSKESLRSPSLITSPEDDKYRLAAHSDAGSLRSFRSNPRWGNDDASSFVGSTRQMPTMADEMDQGLLQNASGMSRSPPVGGIPTSPLAADPILNEKYSSEPKAMDKKHSSMDSSPPDFESVTDSSADLPKELESSVPSAHNDEMFLGSYGQQKAGNLTADKAEGNHVPNETSHTTTRSSLNGFDFGTGNNDANSEHHDIPIIQETTTDTPPVGLPRLSLPMSETSDYGDEPKSNLSPSVNVSEAEDQPRESEDNHQPVNNRATQAFTKFDEGFDPHRLTVGIRPLPPEDPSDNAEQRANRIRSFYKEYFDDSRGVPEEYYEDFGSEFYDDAAVYDPYTGDYVVGPPKPFAQPMARRAMTPPPRFQGPPRPLHSAAGMRAPGPRAFSSASARLPANQGPRKPAPPPEPLHVLPSPHLIKDDMSVLPVDYAPAKTFKERQEGRPDSPHGGLRPFTPSARSHTPLVSSFDDLAAIPSPHAMRKSGLYTTLDFAPPARFRNDTGSDAGSIRSNRTGISAVHTHNIRTGAYRVSRLPPGVVGTKDDLFASLKPSMDLNR